LQLSIIEEIPSIKQYSYARGQRDVIRVADSPPPLTPTNALTNTCTATVSISKVVHAWGDGCLVVGFSGAVLFSGTIRWEFP